MCPCEKNLSLSSPEGLPTHNIKAERKLPKFCPKAAQILSKDLVKYSKYHIHYCCLFCVFKEVSSNNNINSKLNTIIPSSSINKTADTEQGTNKAVIKVFKSTNLTLSLTTVLKNFEDNWNNMKNTWKRIKI